jgi:hypothetical protein
MFTEKDMALHRGLMKLLEDATFPLKAREVSSFALIYSWAKDLPSRNKPAPVVAKKGK